MALVTLPQESETHTGFYVPQFEVRVEGVGLPRDVLRDVISVTYKDSIKEIDSFELTVNNWDVATRDFKYVGAETTATLQGNSPVTQRYRLFEPCRKSFEIHMGYLGDLRLMMHGSTTTLEPNFPNSGPPTLTVRGLNVLHSLRRKQYSTTWQDKRDSDIARNIATLNDPETRAKRFPLPIVIDDRARSREEPQEYVAQNNQYDIDFLFLRARQRGYVVFVQEASRTGTGGPRERSLYFGPSQSRQNPVLRDVTYVLKQGISLVDFKPTLTTANQVKSVTVQGWNRTTRQAIREKVSLQDPDISINRDLIPLLEACEPREEVVVREPVFTPAHARRRALSLLSDRLKEMVTATGSCVGLPDLRAGRRVQIEGIGARFSGTYFVTETTHVINDGGYTTRFNARREEPPTG